MMIGKVSLRPVVLWLAVLSGSSLCFAQPGPDSMIARFTNHAGTLMSEKVFVHTDQQFYLVGETMWFSIYCTDGTFHKPLDVSKVVYVEVLAGTKAVLQAKIAMTEGRGNGSFYLPATLESQTYTIRAYTNWMKNFAPDFYFHQNISIVNPFLKPSIASAPSAGYRVGFFPEGGHLVRGLPVRVGFKVTDAGGKGVPFTGAILGEDGDTVSTFSPLKFGIGSFDFMPGDETYQVAIRDSANRVSKHMLPPILKEGFSMQVRDSLDRWVKVSLRSNVAGTDHSSFLLFGHARQAIFSRDSKRLSSGRATFLIDKNKIPAGISHFTFFDDSGSPVCERLYFKYPESRLEIAVQRQMEYGPRKKVRLEIQTITGKTPAVADISVSVFKADSFAPGTAQTIDQYLWLSSDLTGDIESVDYYFQDPRPEISRAMDNLMLTHGWRKFTWSGLSQEPPVLKFLPEYRHHIVEASISSSTGLVSGMLNYLSVPGNTAGLYATRSDSAGMMRFEVDQLTGRKKLILQGATPAPVELKIIDPFSAVFGNKTAAMIKLQPRDEAALLQRAIAMQAEDIYHDERAIAAISAVSDTLGFYGIADENYYLDDYTRFPVMEEVMREYVPGVFVRKRKDGFHFLVANLQGGVLEDPLILLDGIPVSNADRIMQYDPLKVKKLEVVKKKFFMGSATFAGIVSYTTYSRDAAGLELDPWSVSIDYDGLQLQREFPMPVYPAQKHIGSRVPDRRYLLYWNPRVITGNDGKAALEFYTSDIPGTYNIIVQGITQQGSAGMTAAGFSVR